MKLRGLNLLRIHGIQITVDYSWFIIFFLVVYSMAESYFPPAEKFRSTPQYWLMGITAASLFFLSVLAHELAHSLVALRQGIRVHSIRLFIFGGLAQISSEPKSGRNEFLIALAGPATSMAIGLASWFFYVFLLLGGSYQPLAAMALNLAIANFGLALFNMIPGFPLDGGRILRAILWDRWNDLTRATKTVSQIGNAVALSLILLGVVLLFFTQLMIGGLWVVFIGLFMKQSAVGSYQAAVLKEALSGVQIRQIMTENVVAVDWLKSLEELVKDYVYRFQFTSFPVFDRDEFMGMVSLSDVRTVPKELWGFKQVRDVMTPADHVISLGPTDDATEALSRMATADVGRMPVLENGRLVGIVSRRDIMNLFKIKSDLGLT
jgi:Zn-dependent protease/predicted transcriptional regulator